MIRRFSHKGEKCEKVWGPEKKRGGMGRAAAAFRCLSWPGGNAVQTVGVWGAGGGWWGGRLMMLNIEEDQEKSKKRKKKNPFSCCPLTAGGGKKRKETKRVVWKHQRQRGGKQREGPQPRSHAAAQPSRPHKLKRQNAAYFFPDWTWILAGSFVNHLLTECVFMA